MQRRDFVKAAALGSSASLLLSSCASGDGGAPAVQTGDPSLRWRLVSSYSRGLDTIYGAAEVLAERVGNLTGGRFKILVYPAGELVPAFEVLESVQKGTAQMGHTASYYYIGKSPALAFDTTVPFGLTARQFNSWAYHGGGMELLRSLFADYNILNLPGGNTGVQMGGWFNREVNSAGDLKGLSMRIPGMGGRVMDRLGVTVQQIPGGEIYPALERGAIDAAEWVGPYDDEKLGFAQVARYYYYPGWWEPGANLSFYINRDVWNQLPANYQHVLEVAAAEANLYMLSRYDAVNPPSFRRLIEGGTEVRAFPKDVLDAAYASAQELLKEGTSDPEYAKIYDSYTAWQKDATAWFGTSEQTFADYVHGR